MKWRGITVVSHRSIRIFGTPEFSISENKRNNQWFLKVNEDHRIFGSKLCFIVFPFRIQDCLKVVCSRQSFFKIADKRLIGTTKNLEPFLGFWGRKVQMRNFWRTRTLLAILLASYAS